jgi:hypothetical protein
VAIQQRTAFDDRGSLSASPCWLVVVSVLLSTHDTMWRLLPDVKKMGAAGMRPSLGGKIGVQGALFVSCALQVSLRASAAAAACKACRQGDQCHAWRKQVEGVRLVTAWSEEHCAAALVPFICENACMHTPLSCVPTCICIGSVGGGRCAWPRLSTRLAIMLNPRKRQQGRAVVPLLWLYVICCIYPGGKCVLHEHMACQA